MKSNIIILVVSIITLIALTWIVLPTVFYMVFSLVKYIIGFIAGYVTCAILTKFKNAYGTDNAD